MNWNEPEFNWRKLYYWCIISDCKTFTIGENIKTKTITLYVEGVPGNYPLIRSEWKKQSADIIENLIKFKITA